MGHRVCFRGGVVRIRLRKCVRRFLIPVSALGLLFGLTAGQASAADYGVDMNQACRYTYNNPAAWADFMNPFDAHSWVCEIASATIGIPPSVTISVLGGVDVQKYCTITRPGSRAVVVAQNAYGWRCRT